VICLQEVDTDSPLLEFLSEHGYKYDIRLKGSQGILTAYQTSCFLLKKSVVVDFDDTLPPEFISKTYKTGHGMLVLEVVNN